MLPSLSEPGPFREMLGGRTTTGETTTLEDLSVLARLREDEEG